MSKDIESNPSRISFNPKGVDISALDEIADQRDVSRAELIRTQLRELVAQHAASDGGSTDLHTPDNEELADAYEKLVALSNHPMGTIKVPVEEAKQQLWTQQCPKDSVKSRLLEPLAKQGFISVKAARITVHRRTEGQVAAAEEEADTEFERLEASDNLRLSRSLSEEEQQLRKYQHAGLNAPFRLVGWVASRTLWSDDSEVRA
ncbi:hypothetical protein [Halorarius litoreus]|uniref:hypothetical protein n=1 Tax=Halorarius litoreus TaxID=2962676 RepID=UPI0020CCDE9B|nr:hypothetical protein [Halorarius litoreus]